MQDPDGAVVAALPLCEASPGLLRFIGGAEVSDYLDPLWLRSRKGALIDPDNGVCGSF